MAKRKHNKPANPKVHKKPSKYHLAQIRHMRRMRALYEHHAATGIALLTPFLVILAVSILYRLSIPESDNLANFYGTWIFNSAVVVVWAVVFPVIALAINLGSLSTIVGDHRYNGKIRPKALLRDVWPSLAIVTIVLFTFMLVFGVGLSNIGTTLQGI